MKSVKFERLFERLLASSALGLGLLLVRPPGCSQTRRRSHRPRWRFRCRITHRRPRSLQMQTRQLLPPNRRRLRRLLPTRPRPPRHLLRPSPPMPTARSPTNCATSITGKQLDRMVSRRKAEREGVEQFYKARDYKPLWVSDGAADDRAKAAIAYLAQVDSRRSRPQRLPGAGFRRRDHPRRAGRSRNQVHQFGAHLRAPGRRSAASISLASVPTSSSTWSRRSRPRCSPSSPTASDVGAALDSYNPPQAEFKALRKSSPNCARGRSAKPEEEKPKPTVLIGEGKILRPGMKDARVAQLRKRLDIAGDKD